MLAAFTWPQRALAMGEVFDWTVDVPIQIHYRSESGIASLSVDLPYFGGSAAGAVLNIDSTRDILPEDGWEFLHADLGTPTVAPRFPYFALYNRYRGLVRLFYYQASGTEYWGSAVTLTYQQSGASDAALSRGAEAPFGDEFTPDVGQEYFGNCNSQGWCFADFEIQYTGHPPDFSSWVFNVYGVDQFTLTATGQGTLADQLPASNAGRSAFGSIVSLIRTVASAGANAKKDFDGVRGFYDALKKASTADKPDWVQSQLAGLASSISGFQSTLEAASLFAGFIDTFLGGASGGNTITRSSLDLEISGELRIEDDLDAMVIRAPGATHSNPSEDEVPNFDEPLGVYSLSTRPVVRWSHERTDYKDNCRGGLIARAENIQINVNPALSSATVEPTLSFAWRPNLGFDQAIQGVWQYLRAADTFGDILGEVNAVVTLPDGSESIINDLLPRVAVRSVVLNPLFSSNPDSERHSVSTSTFQPEYVYDVATLPPETARIFRNNSFDGAYITIYDEISAMESGTAAQSCQQIDMDAEISSAVVAPGTWLRLYSERDYSGDTRWVPNSTHTLGSWNDVARSALIVDSTGYGAICPEIEFQDDLAVKPGVGLARVNCTIVSPFSSSPTTIDPFNDAKSVMVGDDTILYVDSEAFSSSRTNVSIQGAQEARVVRLSAIFSAIM